MTLDEILAQINAGLPGTPEEDIAYLEEQTEAYADSEFAKEVARACGRLIYERIPEETKKDTLEKIMAEELRPINDALEEAKGLLEAGDVDAALAAMEALTEKLDAAKTSGLFQDDAASEYYCFNEPFEELLYMHLHQPSRDVRRSAIPFAEAYHLYGGLLMEKESFRAANYVLKEAVRWNPSSAKIRFEYGESFKAMGDMDHFLEITRDTFAVAFRPDDLARCFRNMGYYLSEQEAWNEAAGCYVLSMQYDDKAPMAAHELTYIESKSDGTAKAPSAEDMLATCERYDIPFGPSDLVIGVAYHYGEEFLKHGNAPAAHYFLTIAYDLTEDEDIKAILDKLNQ